ncbi:hypothetical protein F8160_02905 [Bacillus sp. CH126_4D]|uniref:hypothetical protein n=1 Tax=unclassified Bacillus (in: firmicutes) TaxID=185979 RepID=UPI00124C3EEE|nr:MULTISPECIES: hypothetical protein [unclassified Bacillus (in: firmicutes)]KAB2451987.1 hypothetical protein F8162_23345 [Bacillus sp. CH140a_4T]KAB2474614.1 hypothetical protein F8160_02905 [Bacillus sp. CH126_4D]
MGWNNNFGHSRDCKSFWDDLVFCGCGRRHRRNDFNECHCRRNHDCDCDKCRRRRNHDRDRDECRCRRNHDHGEHRDW